MAKKKFKEKEQGQFMGHIACPLEGCGSSDAGAYYLHDDGSYSYSCFSCKGSIPNFDIEGLKPAESKSSGRVINWEVELERLEEVRDGLIAVSMKDRRMKAEYYDFYGVKMELCEDGDTVEAVYYPTYRDDQHVGYRCRSRFKESDKAVQKDPSKLGVLKNFKGGIGDAKKGIQMFGQWLFPEGGKRLIITCGEEDAVAAYCMTDHCSKYDGGWATVSVPSGEDVNWVKPHLPYISSFSEIYVIADADKQGGIFRDELCRLLPVGKVRIVKLPNGYKDPSDMAKKGRNASQRNTVYKRFYNCLWDAQKYSPAGIMSLSEGWSSYTNRGKDTLLRFPDSFGDLNELTHGGYALGEVINIIAPSSVGKSSFVKEMIYETIMSTQYNIGVISLEETIDEFIEGILSVHMSTQLNEIPFDERDRGTEWKKFKELIHYYPKVDEEDIPDEKSERIHFLDHQGACDGEELLEKIDFLTNGLDCKMLILDPVTLACSGGDTDEDEMASEIVKRVKRHKLAWVNVHHVRKNSGSAKANSEGADLAEEDIKGTGAWFQTGMINLIFTRNKVHDDPIVRNTTRIKMSKCRRHGKNTGVAGYIYYNGDTGRLEKGQDISAIVEGNSFDEEDDGPINEWE